MEREHFGNRFGVLVAMAGSAIGLGNLWRFPYMVGEYGGAAFISVYIVFVFVLCLPIMFAEFIVGRRSHTNAFGAFRKLAPGSAWKWTGALMVITPVLVLSYYSVIGGWSLNTCSSPVLSALPRGSLRRIWEECSEASFLLSGLLCSAIRCSCFLLHWL